MLRSSLAGWVAVALVVTLVAASSVAGGVVGLGAALSEKDRPVNRGRRR